MVEGMLGEVAEEPRPARAVMVPHAGLVYSGACAAHGFARVAIPATVVLVGPNHHGLVGAGAGAGLWRRGRFATPLGALPIAEDFAGRLQAECPLVAHDPMAHAYEHSLEVELPFLQIRAPAVAIVPLVLAFDDWDRCRELGQALAAVAAAEAGPVLLVASTDMTHYEPATAAEPKDREALGQVEQLDGEGLLEVCRRRHVSMCGRAAAAVVLEASRQLGADRAEVVDYRHSGWVTGDDSSVVAYAAAVVA